MGLVASTRIDDMANDCEKLLDSECDKTAAILDEWELLEAANTDPVTETVAERGCNRGDRPSTARRVRRLLNCKYTYMYMRINRYINTAK